MIIGTIKVHTEQTKYQYNQEEFSGFSPSYSQREEEYRQLLNSAREAGYVVGARVSCLLTNKRQGVIKTVHQHHTSAYNYNTGTFEPFQVLWDPPVQQYPMYQYGIDEIALVKTIEINPAVEHEQKNPFLSLVVKDLLGESNEDDQHFPISC